MNLKQRESLIKLLDEAPNALDLYTESETCGEDYKYYEMLECELNILEVFSNLPEAREVIKIIRGFIDKLDKIYERAPFPEKEYETDMVLLNAEEVIYELKYKIENK